MAKQDTEQFIYDRLARVKLKSLRKHMHMTQSQIAELSGLSLSTISNIESEDSNASSPRLDSVIAYLNALGYEMKFEIKDELVKKQNMIEYVEEDSNEETTTAVG